MKETVVTYTCDNCGLTCPEGKSGHWVSLEVFHRREKSGCEVHLCTSCSSGPHDLQRKTKVLGGIMKSLGFKLRRKKA